MCSVTMEQETIVNKTIMTKQEATILASMTSKEELQNKKIKKEE